MLADHFVLKFAKESGKPVKRISTPVLESFLAYQWPGNVRELENCIERAVLLANGDTLEVFHLPPSLQIKTKDGEKKEQGKLRNVVESQERSLIIDALKETRGNQSKAAKLLGTTKRITQYKIQKFGIDAWQFRPKRTGSPVHQAEKEDSQTDM
jgi:Nif-specific regulatory protein